MKRLRCPGLAIPSMVRIVVSGKTMLMRLPMEYIPFIHMVYTSGMEVKVVFATDKCDENEGESGCIGSPRRSARRLRGHVTCFRMAGDTDGGGEYSLVRPAGRCSLMVSVP